jgi:hypothetical protein
MGSLGCTPHNSPNTTLNLPDPQFGCKCQRLVLLVDGDGACTVVPTHVDAEDLTIRRDIIRRYMNHDTCLEQDTVLASSATSPLPATWTMHCMHVLEPPKALRSHSPSSSAVP